MAKRTIEVEIPAPAVEDLPDLLTDAACLAEELLRLVKSTTTANSLSADRQTDIAAIEINDLQIERDQLKQALATAQADLAKATDDEHRGYVSLWASAGGWHIKQACGKARGAAPMVALLMLKYDYVKLKHSHDNRLCMACHGWMHRNTGIQFAPGMAVTIAPNGKYKQFGNGIVKEVKTGYLKVQPTGHGSAISIRASYLKPVAAKLPQEA